MFIRPAGRRGIVGKLLVQGLGRFATRAPWLTSSALTGEESEVALLLFFAFLGGTFCFLSCLRRVVDQFQQIAGGDVEGYTDPSKRR